MYFISRFDQVHFKMFAAMDPKDGTRHLGDLLDLKPRENEVRAASPGCLGEKPVRSSNPPSARCWSELVMSESLNRFRERLSDLVLNFVLEQWAALGVMAARAPEQARVIDPEPLLLLDFGSCPARSTDFR